GRRRLRLLERRARCGRTRHRAGPRCVPARRSPAARPDRPPAGDEAVPARGRLARMGADLPLRLLARWRRPALRPHVAPRAADGVLYGPRRVPARRLRPGLLHDTKVAAAARARGIGAVVVAVAIPVVAFTFIARAAGTGLRTASAVRHRAESGPRGGRRGGSSGGVVPTILRDRVVRQGHALPVLARIDRQHRPDRNPDRLAYPAEAGAEADL